LFFPRSLSGSCRRWLVTLGLVLGCWLHAYAQTGNLRTKWVKVTPDATPIDTLSLSPATLKVLSPVDASLRVTYDPGRNTIRFTGENLPDSVLVSYRTFPADLTKPVFHRDPKSYDTVVNFGGKDPLAPVLRERREEFFATKGITKSGSLTRGLSFGNAQNVFVNSALNLQLEGQLSEDVAIQAVISDQNVPYQPEGNTQQLRDFDRVFVQLTGKGWKLLAGDVVFRNPGRLYGGYDPSHFLRYYRSVQGGQAEASYASVGKGRATTSVGVAVSKGKFASMQLPVSEGVQGPYRLRGPGNERFIIVLANSERVYLDGRLLQRGFNFDYVIDYNTAEVTFTPAVVITAYSRVRVDFEYSDRNYSRTILAVTHRLEAGKFRFFSNFYRGKGQPAQPTGSATHRRRKASPARRGRPNGRGLAAGHHRNRKLQPRPGFVPPGRYPRGRPGVRGVRAIRRPGAGPVPGAVHRNRSRRGQLPAPAHHRQRPRVRLGAAAERGGRGQLRTGAAGAAAHATAGAHGRAGSLPSTRRRRFSPKGPFPNWTRTCTRRGMPKTTTASASRPGT
jgi:hypothetical protein